MAAGAPTHVGCTLPSPSASLCAMHAELIDGKATAATIRKEIAAEVAALQQKTGKVSYRFEHPILSCKPQHGTTTQTRLTSL